MLPSLPTSPSLTGPMLRARRAVLARRRLIAAALAALAVLVTVRGLAPPPAPSTPLLVATHDLPGGAALTSADVEVVAVADGLAPVGALSDPEGALGRTLAAPLRAGEPVTDVRLLAPALLDGYPGTVAAPVRLADAAPLDLLRVGDTVAVLAADPAAGLVEAVPVTEAPVVALPEGGGSGVTEGGGLVVLAVPPGDAARLAQAAVTRVLSVTLVR